MVHHRCTLALFGTSALSLTVFIVKLKYFIHTLRSHGPGCVAQLVLSCCMCFAQGHPSREDACRQRVELWFFQFWVNWHINLTINCILTLWKSRNRFLIRTSFIVTSPDPHLNNPNVILWHTRFSNFQLNTYYWLTFPPGFSHWFLNHRWVMYCFGFVHFLFHFSTHTHLRKVICFVYWETDAAYCKTHSHSPFSVPVQRQLMLFAISTLFLMWHIVDI